VSDFPTSGPTDIALSRRTHDRVGERRTDAQWLASTWADPRTRIVVIAGTLFPVADDGVGVRWQGPEAVPEGDLRIFLGMSEDLAHFALVLDELPAESGEQPGEQPRWTTFRGVLATLAEPDAGFMVHAIALAEWHASHRFCPRCGSRLVPHDAGHVLRCEENGHQQFPRTDPAVIMMVTDGDRALLGRQESWPEGRYSTLAGFVDPGESLEEAVVREVAEETGVHVTDVAYFGNQPWPFPQSLMVGFFARATSTDITVDGAEISDARWFTREDMETGTGAGTLVLPGGISISRSLVEAWYGGPLPGSW
jgi:NAD+ diphosphatase